MSDFHFDAATQRLFDEQHEALEAAPVFASTWAAQNTVVLEAARLPLNPIVLQLPPPVVRTYIRLAAAVESFGCDILGTSSLKNERPENLAALGAVHLLEITRLGLFKLHTLSASYPNADDLRNEG